MCDFCPPRFIVRPDAGHEQCPHPWSKHGAIYKTVVASVCGRPRKNGRVCRCLGTKKVQEYVRTGCLARGCKCQPKEQGLYLGETYTKNGIEYNRYGFPGKWSD